MRSLGLFIASLGGSAFIYVGGTLLGELILPPSNTPLDLTTLLITAGIGGGVAMFGLSLALRS